MFENLNIDWNLAAEENSTDFSDEDFNEDKLSPKEYFDWLLSPRTNGDQPNARKKGAETSSMLSNEAYKSDYRSEYKAHLASGQQSSSDSQSRSSSVLDQFPSIQTNSVARLNAKNSLRPPPLPPHSNKVKQQINAINSTANSNIPNALHSTNNHTGNHNNNNNQNLTNLNVLSKKEQFLNSKSSVMHSRTISDLGLKSSLGGHRKNASMDLQMDSQKHSYLADKNRRTYIDSCSQLNLEGSLTSLKRPTVPPPMLPVGHRQSHSNSQSNLLSSGNFNSNQFIASLNNNHIVNNKNDAKLIRRKQAVYIESRHHLSNGQSFESLPSSDDLNNSNNSGSTNHNNLIHNICPNPAVLHTYDPKFSPVPVPPPRRREAGAPLANPNKTKTCLALFDCAKDQDDELEFKANDIIEILKETTMDDQWMLGRIGSRKGVFPSSFVRMLD